MEQHMATTQLVLLAIPAILNEAANPVATLINTAILGHARGDDNTAFPAQSRHRLACFGATQSSIAFASGLFNFLVSVTLAQLSLSIGRKDFKDVSKRTRLSIAIALTAGCVCAALLMLLRQHILLAFDLPHELRDYCTTFFLLRAGGVPLLFLTRVAMGILAAQQRLWTTALISLVSAALDASGNAVGVIALNHGLVGSGVATLVAYGVGALGGLAMAAPSTLCSRDNLASPLKQQHRTINGSDSGLAARDMASEETPLVKMSQSSSSWLNVLSDYLKAAGNIALRSIILQTALYSMAVCAGHISVAALAAHQVIAQLWAVTSYICDGFADVATMIGGRIVARDDWPQFRTLTRRTLLLGVITGAAAAAVLGGAHDYLQRVFTHDEATLSQMRQVWWLLVGMQTINAMVFVFDGLLYALQAFAFKRNIVALGGFVFFVPILIATQRFTPHLLYIWAAYGMCIRVNFRV